MQPGVAGDMNLWCVELQKGLLFGFSYVVLYWRIVRFRSPRWMVFRR